ncbi:AAA family ATPase [soil metagenome]
MKDRLDLLIRSDHPLIVLEARDENEAAEVVRAVATKAGKLLFEWSMTTGLRQTVPTTTKTDIEPGKPGKALEHILQYAGETKEIYLFRDLGPHAKDPGIARQLRDAYHRENVCLIFLDAEPLPESIRRLCLSIEMPLPSTKDLEAIIVATYRKIKRETLFEITGNLEQKDLEQMAMTLRGLTASEAARVVASVIHDDYQLNAEDLPRLIEAKRNCLASTGCLEAITVDVAIEDVGGLVNLKYWLAKRQGGLTLRARQFGIDPPRGLLLLGVQGCGKSLCAKAVAASWKLPLLRLDPGVLYQKYIGETEHRLREALAQAEAMAPVILWIDEIEKAFASASSDSADGGLSQRMFGSLLTWMQDHRDPIFVVATANNIQALPPELMRKGRFDEVFFVDLPDTLARHSIWHVHLKRRKRMAINFDVAALAEASEGFSGAEIEQAVIGGLYTAFAENRELTTDDLTAEIAQTRPLSVLMSEKIAALRAWAEGRTVSAN